jgi:uncharacterized protein
VGQTDPVTAPGPPSPEAPDGAETVRRLVRLTLVVVVLVVVGTLAVVVLADRLDGDDPEVGVPGAGRTDVDGPGGSAEEERAEGRADRVLPEGFGEALVTITADDGETCEVCVLTATTRAARAQGLMGVDDPGLGGYDGMLFEYDDEVQGSFWMRNTLLSLSIAFFDGDGELVSTDDMEPCPDEVADGDCPRHPADGPYRYALEVVQGGLDDVLVGPGSTLEVTARSCPGSAEAA